VLYLRQVTSQSDLQKKLAERATMLQVQCEMMDKKFADSGGIG
jgi:hypothetical protein